MVLYIHHRDFKKDYKKLTKSIRQKFAERLAMFQKNPMHPLLQDHPLQGTLRGKRAFSVTGDIRVIYRYIGKTTILFLGIGSHNQVY